FAYIIPLQYSPTKFQYSPTVFPYSIPLQYSPTVFPYSIPLLVEQPLQHLLSSGSTGGLCVLALLHASRNTLLKSGEGCTISCVGRDHHRGERSSHALDLPVAVDLALDELGLQLLGLLLLLLVLLLLLLDQVAAGFLVGVELDLLLLGRGDDLGGAVLANVQGLRLADSTEGEPQLSHQSTGPPVRGLAGGHLGLCHVAEECLEVDLLLRILGGRRVGVLPDRDPRGAEGTSPALHRALHGRP
ncbi:hypothetical protein B484DRAFT_473129, partial [Ochromonadaceae sp. CCMP2298]